MAGQGPLVVSGGGAPATVVAPAVPDATTLAGRHFLVLDLVPDSFRSDVADPPASLPGAVGGPGSPEGRPVLPGGQAGATNLPPVVAMAAGQFSRQASVTDSTVVEAMRDGFVNPSVFPAVTPGLLQVASDGLGSTLTSAESLSAKLANIQPAEVAALLRAGYQPNVFRSANGSFSFNYLPDPQLTGPGYRGGEVHYGGAVTGAPGQAPVTITSPADDSKISGPRGGFTFTVAGTSVGSDRPPGNPQITRVDVQLSGDVSRPAVPAGPNPGGGASLSRWTAEVKAGKAGSQVLTATATFDDKSQAFTSIAVEVTLVKPADATPPVLTITAPQPGSVFSAPSRGGVVTLSGTATDVGTGMNLVEYSLDGSRPYVAATPKAAGDWSTWTAAVAVRGAGAHQISVRASDKAGNVTEAGLPISLLTAPPRLMLVEKYQLSTFPARYGPGRVVKTLSLLPGEKTTISVKTFTRTTTDAQQASSILDSVTDDSSQDFEDSVGAEQSDKQGFTESQSYKYDEKADAGWGWGSASVSGEQAGSSSSAREEFAKNMSNATRKHSARRSAKRDVQVDTSYEVQTEQTAETSITREVENINLSRTLNFVFQQLDQEFITALHLTDVRVGYFNPDLNFPYREATLPQLDSFLTQLLVPDACQKAREWIEFSLTNVFDYQDAPQSVIEHSPDMKDTSGNTHNGTGYLRFKRNMTSQVAHPVTGDTVTVEGLAISRDLFVMRTEGLLVDSVLGTGDAGPVRTGPASYRSPAARRRRQVPHH